MRADQRVSPPENRLARLGVGPVKQSSASESRANDSLKTAFSLSNVAETVSAAVKRVTGGNSASASKLKFILTYFKLLISVSFAT